MATGINKYRIELIKGDITKLDVKTIAFPNISTGVYRFPKERAAGIAVAAVKEYLSNNENIEKVIFVCFDDENYQLYSKLI